jgi:hypothetical protein
MSERWHAYATFFDPDFLETLPVGMGPSLHPEKHQATCGLAEKQVFWGLAGYYLPKYPTLLQVSQLSEWSSTFTRKLEFTGGGGTGS